MSNEVALQTVVAAYDSGARHFDTAPWYGVGRSERRVGMALGGMMVKREEYTINTKVGRLLEPEPVRDQSKKTLFPSGAIRTPRDPLSGFRVSFDYTGEALLGQCRDSLQRMGTPYIDSLTIHDLDYGSASSEEVELGVHQLSAGGGAAALHRLRESGTVRAIGIGCNMTSDFKTGQGNLPSWLDGRHETLYERIAEVVDLDFMVMAGPYTLLEQPAMRRLLPLCERKGIGMVIATPYCGGLLAAGPGSGAGYMYAEPPPEIMERAKRMEGICERHGTALAAAAIQFPLAHPLTACVIPGAASPEEARQNAAHAAFPVPEDVWRLFREEGMLGPGVPTPPPAADGARASAPPRSSL